MKYPVSNLILLALIVIALTACGGSSRIDPIEAVSAPAVDLPDDSPGISALWRARVGGVDGEARI